eukprot:gene10888-biopygen5275
MKRSDKFPQISLKTRAGCLELLQEYIRVFITRPTPEALEAGFWEPVPHHAFYVNGYTDIIKIKPGLSSVGKSVTSSSSASGVASTLSKDGSLKSPVVACGLFMTESLGHRHSTQQLVTCRKRTKCLFPHQPVRELTRIQAKAAAANAPQALREGELDCCPRDTFGRLHIAVRPSLHAGAALGAFPRYPVAAGTRIGAYFGRSASPLDETTTSCAYRMSWKGLYVDARDLSGIVCRCAYINDPLDALLENVTVEQHGNTLWVVTTQAVQVGQEFGFGYGSCLSRTHAESANIEHRSEYPADCLEGSETASDEDIHGSDWESFSVGEVQSDDGFVSGGRLDSPFQYTSFGFDYGSGDECSDSSESDEGSISTPVVDMTESLEDGTDDLPSAVAREAFAYKDLEKSVEDAVQWGRGYEIRADWIRADLDFFHAHGGSLQSMVSARGLELQGTRLSVDRVNSWVSRDNPDRERILHIASTGVPVMVDVDFIANNGINSPVMSPAARPAKQAMQRMITDLYRESGQGFLVPKSVLQEHPETFHVSRLSWAPKHGKVHGRPITDCSNGGPGNYSLNSQYTKDQSGLLWGKIEHPGLVSITRLFVDYYEKEKLLDPALQWSDLTLWKLDLKGAYTLISFNPADVCRVAVEIDENLLFFFLTGVFGWTGTPAAFQVITRVLQFELRRWLKGAVTMYVDDILGICRKSDLDAEIALACELIKGLLGQNALAMEKYEAGSRLTFIGYDWDLAALNVYVSHKCLLKAVYAFFHQSIYEPHFLQRLQQLSSLANRYGGICPPIQPFVRPLYESYRGMKRLWARTLDVDGRTAVDVVRMLLVLSMAAETSFYRPFASFGPQAATIVVEFDEFFKGIGVIYYVKERSSVGVVHERLVGGFAAVHDFLGFGEDAGYQNTSEFIGLLVGLWGMRRLGFAHSVVELRGDSESALQ